MDEHLKERLVGAVVLAVLAVIFIPWVLTGSPSLEPIGNDEQGDEVTGIETGLQPFNSKIVPLGSATPLGMAPAGVDSDQGPSTTPSLPESARLGAKPDASATVPAAAAAATPGKTLHKTPQKKRLKTMTKGWLVQLGSFSNARNAASLRDRLRKKSYPAFANSSKTANGTITRVYVGPVKNRDSAVALATRLFTDTHLKGMVKRQP